MQDQIINDINVNQLAYRMQRADWSHDWSDDFRVRSNGATEIRYIMDQLKQLSQDPIGKEIGSKLWLQHVEPGTYSRPNFLPVDPMEMVRMTDNQMTAIKSQYWVAGLKEHLSLHVMEQMRRGVPEIVHSANIKNDSDSVSAELHVKRAAETKDYYLNKMDVTVTKEGKSEGITQTFYLTDKNRTINGEGKKTHKQADKFTLKKAANYLAGRPVRLWFVDQKGDPYQAWVKINLKKTESNGNFEMKKYMNNYPFDLEKTLAKYSILELGTPDHHKRLIESLERGNLQKATFVAMDGSKEQLYISPQIGLVKGGSLNVYDLNKDRVPMQTLVDKGYIGQELAQTITERFKNAQVEKAPSLPQESKQAQLPPPNRQRHSNS